MLPSVALFKLENVAPLILNQKYDEAIKLATELRGPLVRKRQTDVADIFIGLAHLKKNEKQEANQILQKIDLKNLSAKKFYFSLSEIYASLDDRESALECLKIAVTHDRWAIPNARSSKYLAEFIEDPEFSILVQIPYPSDPAVRKVYEAYAKAQVEKYDDIIKQADEALDSAKDIQMLLILQDYILEGIIDDFEEHGDANHPNLWNETQVFYENKQREVEEKLARLEVTQSMHEAFERFKNSI